MCDDLTLSSRQQEVFDEATSGSHRVLLVAAGPGSGKTRLFVRTLEHWLAAAPAYPGGVAALSFTNAANDVIQSRLSTSVGPPHFLGTLDSFMLRFVVRPFAHLIGASKSGVRLIPEHTAGNLSNLYRRSYGANPQDAASAFSVSYVGGTEDRPKIEVAGTAAYSRRVSVPDEYVDGFMQAKKAEWANHGRLTHADTHYMASGILLHPAHGQAARSVLSNRFPVILVDELQDTSHFLGRALVALLEGCEHAFLVGDQDQGIYEFAGADAAALFAEVLKLGGAHEEEIKASHRCPSAVCSVATKLSVSNTTITPEDHNSTGRAVLLEHQLATAQPDAALMAEIQSLCGAGETLIILARRGNTVARLEGREVGSVFKNCPFASRMLAALAKFRDSGSRALADLEGVLFEACFEGKRLSSSALRDLGIDQGTWHKATRGYAAACLTFLTQEPTWNEWVIFLKTQTKNLEEALAGASVAVTFRRDNSNGDKRVSVARSRAISQPIEVSTVHQAKGREYDNVVYFFPKPHSTNSPCPSASWFADRSNEETRTGFVAVTRAKQRFILAIHEQSVRALETEAPDFVQLFEKAVQSGGTPAGPSE